MKISDNVHRSLGLTDQEYEKILKILKREPSPTELAMFSVEWSEHCGYPRSRSFLKLLPKKGRYHALIGEDSGGIIVDDVAIIFKMESHNHPSQVEPKQGAATGVGGIIRDIFTAGARPIASLDSLRFGPLSQPYNRYLTRGVVEGIAFYGNCVGVPTVGGEIYFDESYSGNCLVNAMCIGIAKKDRLARAKAFGVGNSILYIGSSTGRDGIGGCSVLASAEFKENEEKRPAVQIGDPFTEKCLIEATLEALDTGHVVGVKDMGAAGLTCATTEMAHAGGSGVEIELQHVPRREANMEPWEVMMSESQERMLMCVKKGKEKEIQDICHKWDLNAVVIGDVIEGDVVRVKDGGKIVAEIRNEALAEAPVYLMPDKRPEYMDGLNSFDIDSVPEPEDCNGALLNLVGSSSIANKSWVYEQYDHMVQTNTVVLPGSDAAVMRISTDKYGRSLAGVKESKKAIAATTDCNSRFCYLDPYRGAQIAVAEASRNLACTGAHAAAVTDCLNFGNPEKPDRFWYFKNCVEGLAEACKAFNVPVVSGNVSFYNESPKGAINPTPTIGMIGIVEDVANVCTLNFKREGDAIILLGDNKEELGGSEYLKEIHGLVTGKAPELDIGLEKAVQATVLEAIEKGLVSSAHDCSEGGLAVALAECCMADKENKVGAVIDSLESYIRKDALLFGESQSRVVLSCRPEDVKKVTKVAKKKKVPFSVIGKCGGDKLRISCNGRMLIDIPVETMHKEWSSSLERKMTS